MSRRNWVPLGDRVAIAAERALASRHAVSVNDILIGIGWLDPGAVERWQRGQVDCLEEVVQTNLPRIPEAMQLFQSWAAERELIASPMDYVDRTLNAAHCISVEAETPGSRRRFGHIGCRRNSPKRSASAWRKRHAAARNWWWSSH